MTYYRYCAKIITSTGYLCQLHKEITYVINTIRIIKKSEDDEIFAV